MPSRTEHPVQATPATSSWLTTEDPPPWCARGWRCRPARSPTTRTIVLEGRGTGVGHAEAFPHRLPTPAKSSLQTFDSLDPSMALAP
jgi:hypothetical protein